MRSVLLSTALVLALALPAQAGPLTIFNITGSWLGVPAGDNTDGAIITINNSAAQGIDTIRWGGPNDLLANQSGYNFNPTDNPGATVNPGESVLVNLGQFDHINKPIDDAPDLVKYDFAFQTNATSGTLNFAVRLDFDHDESDNSPGPPASDDTVTVTFVPVFVPFSFTQGAHQYLFDLLQFGIPDGGGGVTLINSLRSPEDTGSSANLYARISNTSSPVPEPATMIMLGSGLAALAAQRRRRRVS